MTSFKGGRASIGFWQVVDVKHKGVSISVLQHELEGSTDSTISACFMPWNELDGASLVHWNGCLHGKLCSIVGKHAHFVAPRATVELLWQFSSQEVADLSEAILASDMAAKVPAVPYDPIPCATTIAARESIPGSALVGCGFEGCDKSMAVRFLGLT